MRPRVEGDYREPVVLIEQVQGGQCSGLGELELLAAHAERTVDKQHQIQFLALALGFKFDRQHAFHPAPGETFRSVGVLARGEYETAALAHERFQALYRRRVEFLCGNIAQQHRILALEPGAKSFRAGDRNVDALRMQRVPQVMRCFRVALDVKDPGTRPDPEGLRKCVVFRNPIAVGCHLYRDRVGALPLELHREDDFILAGPKHGFLSRNRITIQTHLDVRQALRARVHPHPQPGRLLLPHAFRQIHRFDPRVVGHRRGRR